MGARIELRVESSIEVSGLAVRLANYAFSGSEPVFRSRPEYYLTHLLTSRHRGLADIISQPSAAVKPMTHGMFHFMPARWPIEYRPASAAGRVAQCVFEPGLFEDLTGSTSTWRQCERQSYLDVRNTRIQDLMVQLEQEVALPSFGSRILVEAIGHVIIVELARHFQCNPAPEKPVGQLGGWQLDRIVDFVHANCGNGSAPSTGDIAALCNISTGHLTRSFKSTTGKTLHKFVEHVRIEKAQALLRGSDLPLKVIAAQSGFSTPSRLSEAFRRQTGEQPHAYRQRVRSADHRAN